MIIDVHTHIGQIKFPVGRSRISSMKEDTLIASMEKYSIDFALVSSIEGAEFNSDMQLMPPEMQIGQIESMNRLIDFVRNNRSRVKALLWVKPFLEERNQELDDFVIENREFIAGIKIHPTLSNLEFTDKSIIPYIELAEENNFPILIHTQNDGRSNVGFVEVVASKYRDVKFIMAHMAMGSDNNEAIEIIKRNRNIWGDTALVDSMNVIKAINECGSERILFGTDSTFHGIDTYKEYLPIISAMEKRFSTEEVDNVLYKNCMRLFKLENILKT